MKTIQTILFLAITLVTTSAFAFPGTETVEIKTSALCGDCEERIETALYNQKGVKAVDLNMETKIVTVTYNTKKTDITKLKTAINNAGYTADEMPANEDAYNKLPKCCQIGESH